MKFSRFLLTFVKSMWWGPEHCNQQITYILQKGRTTDLYYSLINWGLLIALIKRCLVSSFVLSTLKFALRNVQLNKIVSVRAQPVGRWWPRGFLFFMKKSERTWNQIPYFFSLWSDILMISRFHPQKLPSINLFEYKCYLGHITKLSKYKMMVKPELWWSINHLSY